MEQLILVNGNNQNYVVDLPKIVYITDFINEIALNHIAENTGLHFIKSSWVGYEAQPTNSQQIVKLFLTYNFKTEYHDNNTNKNTIFLKSMHNVGFKIDSICFSCCENNHIPTNNLEINDRLLC